MKKLKNITVKILLIGLLFLTFSCTVTKRYHNKGFHVEWRKNYWNKKQVVQTKTDTTNQTIAVVSDEIPLVAHSFDNTKTPTISVNKPEPVIPSTNIQKSNKQQHINRLQKQSLDKQIKKSKPDNLIKVKGTQRQQISDTPQVEGFTWATFGVLIAFIVFILLVIFIYIDFLFWALFVVFPLTWILLSVFISLSILKIIDNPENYKGKGFSWTMFGFVIFGAVAPLIAVLIWRLFFIK